MGDVALNCPWQQPESLIRWLEILILYLFFCPTWGDLHPYLRDLCCTWGKAILSYICCFPVFQVYEHRALLEEDRHGDSAIVRKLSNAMGSHEMKEGFSKNLDHLQIFNKKIPGKYLKIFPGSGNPNLRDKTGFRPSTGSSPPPKTPPLQKTTSKRSLRWEAVGLVT